MTLPVTPEVASDETCCDALCLLHAVVVFLQVWIPDYGTILQEGADKGSIGLLFTGWWAAFEVSS